VNCLGIGAPAAVAQLEAQAELGVKHCISIGTAGGFQADQEPGDVVLLTSAVRDEGTSYHYLLAGVSAVPDRALTSRFADALNAAGIACMAGATVTTDAPTAPPPRRSASRANGVRTQEMEAAALFALGQVRGLPVASAGGHRRGARPGGHGVPWPPPKCWAMNTQYPMTKSSVMTPTMIPAMASPWPRSPVWSIAPGPRPAPPSLAGMTEAPPSLAGMKERAGNGQRAVA